STRCGVDDLRKKVPMEMVIPIKNAISRLKMRHERKVMRNTQASSLVARKQSLISFQFIDVGTVAIRSAARAASGICCTKGQQEKIIRATKRPLKIAAKR